MCLLFGEAGAFAADLGCEACIEFKINKEYLVEYCKKGQVPQNPNQHTCRRHQS